MHLGALIKLRRVTLYSVLQQALNIWQRENVSLNCIITLDRAITLEKKCRLIWWIIVSEGEGSDAILRENALN